MTHAPALTLLILDAHIRGVDHPPGVVSLAQEVLDSHLSSGDDSAPWGRTQGELSVLLWRSGLSAGEWARCIGGSGGATEEATEERWIPVPLR